MIFCLPVFVTLKKKKKKKKKSAATKICKSVLKIIEKWSLIFNSSLHNVLVLEETTFHFCRPWMWEFD